MMPLKLIVLLSIVIFSSNNSFTQTNKYDVAPKSPSFYFGLGTGINANTGIFGIKLDARVNESILIEASAGIGTWGNKIGLGLILNAINSNSWCPVISISRATGIDNVSSNLELQNSSNIKYKRDVDMNLKPATLFNIGMQRHWVRPKGNRIVLELGYSILVAGGEYNATLNPGEKLSDISTNAMDIIKPGGIMIGFSYNFGIN
jgi:hypothetical protein